MIFTVTAGYGHHATAAAIEDELKSRGVHTQVIDVYKTISKLAYKTIDKGYLISTKYASDVYRTVYTALERKKRNMAHYNPVAVVNMIGALKMERWVDEMEPDVIVCTHIFAAQLVDEMKKRGYISAPAIGICTDYTIHPYWEDVPRVEYIVLASELLTYRALKRGIRKECILPMGIPIRPRFSRKISKEEARGRLGLPIDRKTILVMCGSMGYGRMGDLVRRIRDMDENYELIVVCGNNKRVYAHLLEQNEGQTVKDGVHLYGFTDQVDIMMDAADCIVTKPGGLTVTESLEKKLPMVLVSPIPGQEERNIDFLLNNGMATVVTKSFEVDEAIHYLFKNPDRLRIMEESIASVHRPRATEEMADFIIRLGAGEITPPVWNGKTDAEKE